MGPPMGTQKPLESCLVTGSHLGTPGLWSSACIDAGLLSLICDGQKLLAVNLCSCPR